MYCYAQLLQWGSDIAADVNKHTSVGCTVNLNGFLISPFLILLPNLAEIHAHDF